MVRAKDLSSRVRNIPAGIGVPPFLSRTFPGPAAGAVRSLVSVLFPLLFLAAACGKKGDPSPPLPRGPNAIKDLSVEQEGGEALLAFTYPDRLLNGQPLTDLQSIEIYRLAGATPSMGQPRPGSSSAGAPSGGGAALGNVPGGGARRAAMAARMAEQGFYRDAVPVARLSVAEIATRTHGATILYRDPLLALLTQSQTAPSLGYAAVSVRRTGDRSPLSNIAILAPDIPPGPPVILSVTPEEGRICLEWLAPEIDMAGRPARIGGYKVYRRQLSDDEYDASVTASPVSGTSYVDTSAPYAGPLAYTVRATLPGKPRIEGLPAVEAALEYRDVYPPPAPRRLDALSEGRIVRLAWDPVPAGDLAGYLVFRAEGDAAPVQLTPQPIKDSFMNDEAVKPGTRYRYTVRAIDTTGNLGPPSPEATAEPF
jgi:hypothetical protein